MECSKRSSTWLWVRTGNAKLVLTGEQNLAIKQCDLCCNCTWNISFPILLCSRHCIAGTSFSAAHITPPGLMITRLPAAGEMPRERRSFPCEVCAFVALDRVGLERHMRTHTGERPFACPVCARRFNHKSNLATHMRRHTGERPFPCDACGRSFGFKVALVKHMQEEHRTEPLRCVICSAVFATPNGLDEHTRCHAEEPVFTCTTCGRPFKHKRNLARHAVDCRPPEHQGRPPPPLFYQE